LIFLYTLIVGTQHCIIYFLQKKFDINTSKAIEKKLEQVASLCLLYKKHGLNSWYSSCYVLCEFLNFFVVLFNIYFTDIFLSGDFGSIGFDVLRRILNDDGTPRTDALTFTFPKVTKCEFRMFGPSKSIVKYDYICILPVNAVNEKIYIIIWYKFLADVLDQYTNIN
jgi:hypothetical protein